MKRKLWSVALILCLVALLSAGSLAYFTTTGTADNVITAGNLRARLVEQTADGQPFPADGLSGIMPGQVVDKVVFVENTGDHPAYIRIRLSKQVKAADGQTPLDDAQIRLLLAEQGWVEQDGWYYYAQALPAGAQTTPLLQQVEFLSTMDNSYMDCEVTVSVEMQAVQSEHNGASALEAAGWPAALAK